MACDCIRLHLPPRGRFAGFAYHDETMQGYEKNCFGIERDGFTWDPVAESGVTSGFLDLQNTWVRGAHGHRNTWVP